LTGTRCGESKREQFAGPPVEQCGGAALVAEIHVGDVVFAMRMARIEPRFFRFERMEPVRVLSEEGAVGRKAIDHEVGQHGEAMLARRGGKAAQRFGSALLRREDRVQVTMVADNLRVSGPSRLEQRADQRMIEAERGGVREVRRPRVEGPDEERVEKIDPRRIPL
jgi:hypothetical protein